MEHILEVNEALFWIAVALVTIVSAARITRLVTYDSFPPSVRVRMLWSRITKDGEWALLVYCGYCFSFWATGFVVLWGYIADWHWTWWLANGILAASYRAAIQVANDGDDGDED